MKFSERYPPPDPSDPFAPLWVLRSRTLSTTEGQSSLPSNDRPLASDSINLFDQQRRASFFLIPEPPSTHSPTIQEIQTQRCLQESSSPNHAIAVTTPTKRLGPTTKEIQQSLELQLDSKFIGQRQSALSLLTPETLSKPGAPTLGPSGMATKGETPYADRLGLSTQRPTATHRHGSSEISSTFMSLGNTHPLRVTSQYGPPSTPEAGSIAGVDNEGDKRKQSDRNSQARWSRLLWGSKRPSTSSGIVTASDRERASFTRTSTGSSNGALYHKRRPSTSTGDVKLTISPPLAGTAVWESQAARGKFVSITASPVYQTSIPTSPYQSPAHLSSLCVDDTLHSGGAPGQSSIVQVGSSDNTFHPNFPRQTTAKQTSSDPVCQPSTPEFIDDAPLDVTQQGQRPLPGHYQLTLDESIGSESGNADPQGVTAATPTDVSDPHSIDTAPPESTNEEDIMGEPIQFINHPRERTLSLTTPSSIAQSFLTAASQPIPDGPLASVELEPHNVPLPPSPSPSPYVELPHPSPIIDATVLPNSSPRPDDTAGATGDIENACNCPHDSPPNSGPFTSEWSLPSKSQLERAATLPIYPAFGTPIPFGSLFAEHRTIVLFLRHFFCPLCQDYVASLASLVKQPSFSDNGTVCTWNSEYAKVKEADQQPKQVQLVLIGCGSPALVEKYRDMFDVPFKMYADPDMKIYDALGMGKMKAKPKERRRTKSWKREVVVSAVSFNGKGRRSGGSVYDEKDAMAVDEFGDVLPVVSKLDAWLASKPMKEKGNGYTQRGFISGIAKVVLRALRVGMPVWENGGDIAQLGGEFVLGPGMSCSFAHRMQIPEGHAPILDVLKSANVDLPADPSPRTSSSSGVSRKNLNVRVGDPTFDKKSLNFLRKRRFTAFSSNQPPPALATFRRSIPITTRPTSRMHLLNTPTETGPESHENHGGHSSVQSHRDSLVTAGSLQSMGTMAFSNTNSSLESLLDKMYGGRLENVTKAQNPPDFFKSGRFKRYPSTTLPIGRFDPASPDFTIDEVSEDRWMESRERDMETLRMRKLARRAGAAGMDDEADDYPTPISQNQRFVFPASQKQSGLSHKRGVASLPNAATLGKDGRPRTSPELRRDRDGSEIRTFGVGARTRTLSASVRTFMQGN